MSFFVWRFFPKAYCVKVEQRAADENRAAELCRSQNISLYIKAAEDVKKSPRPRRCWLVGETSDRGDLPSGCFGVVASFLESGRVSVFIRTSSSTQNKPISWPVTSPLVRVCPSLYLTFSMCTSDKRRIILKCRHYLCTNIQIKAMCCGSDGRDVRSARGEKWTNLY